MSGRTQRTATSRARQRHRQRRRADTYALRTYALREVARLAKGLFQQRDWIWPPEELFDAAGLERDFASALRLNAPHWNGVREIIGEDGTGYAIAMELLGRLEQRVMGTGEAARKERERHLAALEASKVIGAEVATDGAMADPYGNGGFPPGRFDPESTIYDSLGSPVIQRPDDESRRWRWEIEPFSAQTDHVRYVLRMCHPSLQFDGSPSELVWRLRGEQTWFDALWRARALGTGIYGRTAEDKIAEWRFEVVSAVVEEFDLLGYVAPADRPEDLQLRRLTEEERAFVETAISLKADPQKADELTSTTKCVGEIAVKMDISEYKATEIAKGIGAYVEQGGRGKATPSSSAARLRLFWSSVEAWGNELTVKDR